MASRKSNLQNSCLGTWRGNLEGVYYEQKVKGMGEKSRAGAGHLLFFSLFWDRALCFKCFPTLFIAWCIGATGIWLGKALG